MYICIVRVTRTMQNNEQMIVSEDQFLNNVLDKLSDNIGMDARYIKSALAEKTGIDGHIIIDPNGKNICLYYEIKMELRSYQIDNYYKRPLSMEPDKFIFIAQKISSKVRELLHEKKINYIDAAGNAFIQNKNFHIYIEGKKQQVEKTGQKARAFSKAGLHVVFAFLTKPELINKPYREVAKFALVSLDTITKTMNSLREMGFLIKLNEATYIFNKKE